ncbi:MAG: hypothetical protein ACJ8CB_10805 [Ktedonobacteraceae bacterium]
MRRHPRQRQRNFVPKYPKLPMLLFTLDQLVFLRKAVTLVEQMLLTKKKPLPNVNFALETVTQVQAKLNQMIIQGVWGVDIGFDFNEIVILQTAVWIFATRLEHIEPSPESEDLKEQCRTINLILAPVSKQTHMLH